MNIDLWQVPLLVGAGIITLAGVAYLIERRWPGIVEGIRSWRHGLRFGFLVVLSVAFLPFLWVAVQAADTTVVASLAAVATLVVEVATLWFTLLSYREVQREKKEREARRHAQAAPAGPPAQRDRSVETERSGSD